MNKEEAIKRIEEFGLHHAIKDMPNSAKTVEAFNMAIEALKAQTPDNYWYDRGFHDGYGYAQEWTPCSNGLPREEEKKYWVCTDTGYQCECRWTNNRFGICKTDNWGWSIVDVPQYSKVVAWMSLPEPYREGGEV